MFNYNYIIGRAHHVQRRVCVSAVTNILHIYNSNLTRKGMRFECPLFISRSLSLSASFAEKEETNEEASKSASFNKHTIPQGENHAVVSVFDLFSIGIGPSSSHTVGPMRAAKLFVDSLKTLKLIESVRSMRVDLYGSLALTGDGHGTPNAILMGMENETPDAIDTTKIDTRIESMNKSKRLHLGAWFYINFNSETDLVYHKTQSLPQHPNGMRFTVFDEAGTLLATNEYFSVGGGFVVNDETQHGKNLYFKSHNEPKDSSLVRTQQSALIAALPFTNAQDLLDICDARNLSIADIVMKNEMQWRSPADIASATLKIWKVMNDSIKNGMNHAKHDYLPGPLKVRRRASKLFEKLRNESGYVPTDMRSDHQNVPSIAKSISNSTSPYPANVPTTITMPTSGRKLYALDWLSLFAISVNEENAAGGRVVTAPTNGAAGVIPSVLKYYLEFICPSSDPVVQQNDIIRFLHTAAAIGMLYKRGASISAAEVGCQGEVGVACSMSAAALCAVMGGTVRQVENAAEIGMEHNLGLTCDPIAGLVQIPCIERNALGAAKAVTAAQLALHGNGEHRVSLDQVIRTMKQTGADMQNKYKETSLGGLAQNVPLC